jgi:hypothetical protein
MPCCLASYAAVIPAGPAPMMIKSNIFQFLQRFRKFFDLQMCSLKISLRLKILFPFIRIGQCFENIFVKSMRHHDEQIAESFVAVEERLDNGVRKLCVWQIDV